MSEKLNPQIQTVSIGVKQLRSIKIYPLAFADQIKMTDLITEAIQKLFTERGKVEGSPNIEVVSFFVDIIRENAEQLFSLVTDKEEKVLENITNLQLVEIAGIIYEMNYEVIAKNVKSLFGKIGTLSPSKRLSPRSAKSTHRTASKTSTKKGGKKVV